MSEDRRLAEMIGYVREVGGKADKRGRVTRTCEVDTGAGESFVIAIDEATSLWLCDEMARGEMTKVRITIEAMPA